MNKKIETAINNQINAEIYSAYLYLAMAAYFDSVSLPGFAHWMKTQFEEEMAHAMKFYDYVYSNNGTVQMKAIAAPPVKFKSPLDVFKFTLSHEKTVTKLINNLFELAITEKDYASESFLKWFIDEQVEEENTASEIIDKINLAGEKGPGMFFLDKELRSRPSPAQGSNK